MKKLFQKIDKLTTQNITYIMLVRAQTQIL